MFISRHEAVVIAIEAINKSVVGLFLLGCRNMNITSLNDTFFYFYNSSAAALVKLIMHIFFKNIYIYIYIYIYI